MEQVHCTLLNSRLWRLLIWFGHDDMGHLYLWRIERHVRPLVAYVSDYYFTSILEYDKQRPMVCLHSYKITYYFFFLNTVPPCLSIIQNNFGYDKNVLIIPKYVITLPHAPVLALYSRPINSHLASSFFNPSLPSSLEAFLLI